MTQENSPAVPEQQPTPEPKKKHWKRRILIAGGVLVILLAILIALAPTLACSSWARAMVVSEIQNSLGGCKLQISDYSVGWFSGFKTGSIKLNDPNDAKIVEISQISTGLTLWHAITGNRALGNITIDGLDFSLHKYADGHWNYSPMIAKSSSSTPMPSSSDSSAGSGKLPAISGTININKANGTVQTDASGTTAPSVMTVAGFSFATSISTSATTSSSGLAGLNATGVLSLDSFDYSGASLKNFTLPINMANGILRPEYADKPAGQNLAVPATLNSGQLDLGDFSLDLTGPIPILNYPGVDESHPHQLVKDATLNPAFAQMSLGNFLNNPAFKDASTAQGLLNIFICNCQDIPLSASLVNKGSKGTVHVQTPVTQVRLGSPVLQKIPGLKSDSIALEIPKCDVTIADGESNQDMTLMVEKKEAIRLHGGVNLATQQFDNMIIEIPFSLVGVKIPALGSAQSIQVPLTGTMTSPQLDTKNLLGGINSGDVGNLLNKYLK
jgi:hypothetical protein